MMTGIRSGGRRWACASAVTGGPRAHVGGSGQMAVRRREVHMRESRGGNARVIRARGRRSSRPPGVGRGVRPWSAAATGRMRWRGVAMPGEPDRLRRRRPPVGGRRPGARWSAWTSRYAKDAQGQVPFRWSRAARSASVTGRHRDLVPAFEVPPSVVRTRGAVAADRPDDTLAVHESTKRLVDASTAVSGYRWSAHRRRREAVVDHVAAWLGSRPPGHRVFDAESMNTCWSTVPGCQQQT